MAQTVMGVTINSIGPHRATPNCTRPQQTCTGLQSQFIYDVLKYGI